MVKLATFDQNWWKEFCGEFSTPPAQWRQQDREGKPRLSWYGGDYLPACKNNPDWRTHEKFIVRLQLELGNDGIFFDNPTVHPQGFYCEHCLTKFVGFLASEGIPIELPANDRILFLWQLATTRARNLDVWNEQDRLHLLAYSMAVIAIRRPGFLACQLQQWRFNSSTRV